MKTTLPKSISSILEAKAFLKELHDNDESYHPEDDAKEIINLCNDTDTGIFTMEEAEQLNKLMADIYSLEGNQDMQNMAFDPCGYLLSLCPEYMEAVKADDIEFYNELLSYQS